MSEEQRTFRTERELFTSVTEQTVITLAQLVETQRGLIAQTAKHAARQRHAALVAALQQGLNDHEPE